MRAWLRFLAVFLAFFLPVYAGSGALNAWMPERAVQLYLPWEKDIPLVPWMIWPYLSLYTVYLLPLFHLDAARMKRLTLQSVVVVLAAGLVFLLLPVTSGFPPRADAHGPMLRLIALVDTPYNLVPSLHVACAALILLACGERARPALRVFYLLWFAVLAASTVLVHQHHLVDVAAGYALAFIVRRLLPLNAAPASP